jgi:hypothetical protein
MVSDSSADPSPDVPGFLKASLNVVVAEEQPLEGQRTAEPGRALQIACTHIKVWTAGV